VHLSKAASNKYTHFLSQIQGRKTVIKPELSSSTSFLSWVDRKGATYADAAPLLRKRPEAPVQRVSPVQQDVPQDDPAQMDHEHLLDEEVDLDGFVYNVEEAMALLEVVTEDEKEL